jgi:MSHA biogenesis protein MshP
MRLNFNFTSRLGLQRGVSLVAAIFLLMLMAGLAAFMASILSATHVNLAADIGGSRAYQAARAGVEWGMFQLDPNAQSSTLPTCASASGTLNVIPGHTVEVICVPYPSDATFYQEGGKQVRIFRIFSTAKAIGVTTPKIERQVVVTIEKCRDAAITVAPYDC